jgi:hypothetical protein
MDVPVGSAASAGNSATLSQPGVVQTRHGVARLDPVRSSTPSPLQQGARTGSAT